MLGLRFCVRAFSSCGEWGPLLIAVRGPLTIAASPVAEQRLQTLRLSSCGSRAQVLHGMWFPPRPGPEPVSPAPAGRFSTTVPPGKPLVFLKNLFIYLFIFLMLFLSAYILLIYVCMYVCMALLGLHFCARAFSSCGKRGPLFIGCGVHSSSRCAGLSLSRPLIAEHRLQTRRLSNCGSRAELLRGMWDLPRPGLEPAFLALAGRLSTTAPPGKPQPLVF